MAHRYRIGFDIGGTFTDFVLLDNETGDIRLHKRFTTPEDPSRCAIEGLEAILRAAGLEFEDVGELIHGTTLVTNALIERKGVKLGLITTNGFRDLLEMGTEQRYDIYDLFLEFPEPLVPRKRRLEVPERMDREGRVRTPLDEAAVRAGVRDLASVGVEAIAICFLHSYRNPAHEQRAAEIVREEVPGIRISISSDVGAELWEYQRTVTTCVNAYVQPLIDRYVSRLEMELARRGFHGELRLMHSAGGTMSASAAQCYPIRLLESGPAGGALVTNLFGRRAGHPSVISFDMGGTTAKACLIENGQAEIAPVFEAARAHRFKKGSGLPIKVPVIDMIEIGAGGGSIAWIDEVGLLRVGPRSAGAVPGPACYGRGGVEPTVTDANVVLGYYDPAFFLSGEVQLDRTAAERAIASIAAPLGLSVVEAAWGIHKIVVETMANAARVHVVEKGKDPRRYAMVGFGGAGPAHAAGVAGSLGVKEVIVPPVSGAAAALGFLTAPLSFERVRSLPVTITDRWDPAPVNVVLAELEQETGLLLQAVGVAGNTIHVERAADMRLAGQLHEITVKLPDDKITRESQGQIEEAFRKVYSARYTSVYDGAALQIVNLRVRCWTEAPELSLREHGSSSSPKIKGVRPACFEGRFLETTVYDRYALGSSDRIEGPAIIEEGESTTVLPPGDSLTVDAAGNLRITIGASAGRQALLTGDMSREEAIARIESDPVGLEIMWSRLVTVVDEMWLTVCRTAFSLIISESQDFACELLDRKGETLAHSPRAMPVFNLTLPRAVKALLARFPPETLEPGDVLITNDPWLCAGHLSDIALVMPVFKDGAFVGLVGTVGHASDIGGTKDSLRAREVYEEGIQIPPMKLFRDGRPNEDLLALVAENVRNPDQVLGDIHALVAANRLGAERLCAFMDEYALASLEPLAAVFQGRSESAMREAIRRLPDGVYTSESWANPMGTPLRFPVKLLVRGDEIEVDFEGAPPQLPQGGLNATLNYTSAHATYPLKCMLTPNVRGNAGCYKPFTVRAPEGSILNCRKPASVNMRLRTGWSLAPGIFRALAEAAPERVQAFTGLPVVITIYGYEPATDRLYSDHLFMGGGQGASLHRDGKSGMLWPTSAANTSIELFETRVPVLVLEKSYVTDSGGAGRHRGGLGQRVRIRKLDEDGQPTLVSLYPEGVGIEVAGLFGGAPGGRAFGGVRASDGTLLRDCGTGELITLSTTSEQAELMLAGGSGYGNPAERPPQAVAEDVENGYISSAAAGRDYGRCTNSIHDSSSRL